MWTNSSNQIRVIAEATRSRSLSRRILIGGLIAVLAIVVTARVALPWALGLTGHEITVVHGPSMGSAAMDGSIVLTEAREPGSLRTGDILVFQAPWAGSDGRPTNVVHRLALITPSPIGLLGYTAGDANVLADPEPIMLEGKQQTVVAVIPHLGVIFSPTWNLAVNVALATLLLTGLATLMNLRSAPGRAASQRTVGALT